MDTHHVFQPRTDYDYDDTQKAKSFLRIQGLDHGTWSFKKGSGLSVLGLVLWV